MDYGTFQIGINKKVNGELMGGGREGKSINFRAEREIYTHDSQHNCRSKEKNDDQMGNEKPKKNRRRRADGGTLDKKR